MILRSDNGGAYFGGSISTANCQG